MENSIIRKAIFSNNKVISIEEHNSNSGNSNGKEYYIRVITEVNNQSKSFSCKINCEPYDVVEDSNYIIIGGNNIIELYNFNQNNNGQIAKISEVILDNNSNNNNNDIYKVLCIEKTNKYLICGHSLGYISKWVTIQNSPFLENIKTCRIHVNSINKLLVDTIENREVIISCSSDRTLKVHSLVDFVCFKVLDFDEEVVDAKKVINHNNQTNYFINIRNGNLMLYDSSFSKVLVDVNNESKISRQFTCLNYSKDNAYNNFNINVNNNDNSNANYKDNTNANNNGNNNNNDNTNANNNDNINANNNDNSINVINDDNNSNKKINILITEGNKIYIYDWIKKKSLGNKNNYNNNNYYNNNFGYYNDNYNNNYNNYYNNNNYSYYNNKYNNYNYNNKGYFKNNKKNHK